VQQLWGPLPHCHTVLCAGCLLLAHCTDPAVRTATAACSVFSVCPSCIQVALPAQLLAAAAAAVATNAVGSASGHPPTPLIPPHPPHKLAAPRYLWWHNGWAQVCKGVEASPQTQQATLRPLLCWKGVPLVAVAAAASAVQTDTGACNTAFEVASEHWCRVGATAKRW
jgi:hypothetical protein